MEHQTGPDLCLNCSNPMREGANYCSSCGQKKIGPHDHSVWHLVLESVGDFFHLDSKFFATLRPMMFQPGKLTLEFLAGRKARYFHPFKLFLFLSFLYFLTTGILDHRNTGDSRNMDVPEALLNDSVRRNLSRGTYKLHMDGAFVKGIDIDEDSLRKMVRKHGLNRYVNIHYPDAGMIQRYLIKKVIKSRLDGRTNMDDSMAKTIPKLVFVLIPFFAFLLWLLYRKQKVPYFNHVLFTLHFLAFFFLLFWFKELISLLTGWLNPVIVAGFLAYLYFALKRVYGQKPWTTAGKYFLFLLGSMLALLIFIFIAASISFMMI